MSKRKIALLGPESTGKSTLAEFLADHFNGSWVPEFARSYLEGLNRPYDFDDVIQCVRGQRRWEEQSLQRSAGPLFFDTEMINLHVWMMHKYGHAPGWILDGIEQRYDFYLLTAPDLPFAPDPLRENPAIRSVLFDWYRKELSVRTIPFAIISGTGEARIQCALNALHAVGLGTN